MLHGGAENDRRPVDGRSLSLRRAQWLRTAIRPGMVKAGIALCLLRFEVRGWNAGSGEPAPVADARWALDRVREEYGDLPVVLLGHSMGGRTAIHVADDRSVVGVVGLAPWFPPGEPVRGLTDVHLVAAHGRRDRITSAGATRQLLARAEPLAASTKFIDMGFVGHYLLQGVRRWNRVALEECLRIHDMSARTSSGSDPAHGE